VAVIVVRVTTVGAMEQVSAVVLLSPAAWMSRWCADIAGAAVASTPAVARVVADPSTATLAG